MTLGDPRGVGPEVVVKALPTLSRHANLIIFGHSDILEVAAHACGRQWSGKQTVVEPSLNVGLSSSKRRCGEASLAYIRDAVKAVGSKKCDAIVTAPICKEHIHLAGARHPGHTELLAQYAGSKKSTFLMMAGKQLKVVLVTLHVPLAKVPKLATKARILRTLELTDQVMRERYRIKQPRIALAGLNPHAGEAGLFGTEEIRHLQPAVKAARRKGIMVVGPLPGDTVFYQAAQGDYDVVVSLYHDQGLAPVKLLHFEDAVNMTLGLPFVRTSVDHGVAFDIAWQGIANPKSMIAAGKLAAALVGRGASRSALRGK